MGRREGRLAELERRCADEGLPVTLQRRAVLEALSARGDHPTADELTAELAHRGLLVSRATVYRTLEALAARRVVSRVSHPGPAARFEARTDRHDHLICDHCGSVRDLEDAKLEPPRSPDLTDAGFRPCEVSVTIRGTCSRCAEE